MERDFLWVEKYRPSKVSDCILPERLEKQFSKIVKEKDHNHMTFAGPPGTGKTSLAVALCNDMNRTVLFINGSDENGIDTFRTTIKSFATRLSIDDSQKTVIIDEANQLNPKTIQEALRSFLEQYAHICKFIFSTNNVGAIIEPLLSRAPVVNFSYGADEKQYVAKKYITRLKSILSSEGVKYDEKALVKFVVAKFPDFRSVINSCQIYANTNGEIDIGILASSKTKEDYAGLVDALKKKDFRALEDFAVRFSTEESNTFYRTLYGLLKVHVTQEAGMLNMISIIGDSQKYFSSVADKYIHILTCLADLMASGCIDG